MPIQPRLIVYSLAFAAIASLFAYFKYQWHDKLIKDNEHLAKQLEMTGEALNKCYIQGRKNSVESFIEGVGNVDENISINLGSLHT